MLESQSIADSSRLLISIICNWEEKVTKAGKCIPDDILLNYHNADLCLFYTWLELVCESPIFSFNQIPFIIWIIAKIVEYSEYWNTSKETAFSSKVTENLRLIPQGSEIYLPLTLVFFCRSDSSKSRSIWMEARQARLETYLFHQLARKAGLQQRGTGSLKGKSLYR